MNMCNQDDAPLDVLNTYNNWYADDWIPDQRKARPSQPPMWTENWAGTCASLPLNVLSFCASI